MSAGTDKILVADDEPAIRELLVGILTGQGYEVDAVEDGASAINALNKKVYSVCITDLKMPQADGIAVLKHIQDSDLDTLGVVATAYGSVESAVDALRSGAFDYITKPFHIDDLKAAVERAVEVRRLRRENVILRRNLDKTYRATNMIGRSASMEEVYGLIQAVADSDSTILIFGESGTGKELVARTLHQESPRHDHLMVPVNCGAIPENLLESEMFGHVKGAFTGAVAMRAGRFQLADKGTIFLDEIGEMSPQLQVKLLRVLQEGTFEMIASTETVEVNVRILAATNRNLEEMVEKRQFREDLYYRLNVIPIQIPPLRERIEDLPLLLDHFIQRFNREKNRAFEGFDDASIEMLRAYPWPGNVREVENLVERCVILTPEGKVTPDRLPERYRDPNSSVSAPMTPGRFPESGVNLNELIDGYEARLIKQALEMAGGVKNRAAQLLNVKRTTLVEKMKKKGMA